MASGKELARRLGELQKPIASQDESMQTLFQAIRQLMAEPEMHPKKIGFQFFPLTYHSPFDRNPSDIRL
jgi:hypothetical protein